MFMLFGLPSYQAVKPSRVLPAAVPVCEVPPPVTRGPKTIKGVVSVKHCKNSKISCITKTVPQSKFQFFVLREVAPDHHGKDQLLPKRNLMQMTMRMIALTLGLLCLLSLRTRMCHGPMVVWSALGEQVIRSFLTLKFPEHDCDHNMLAFDRLLFSFCCL